MDTFEVKIQQKQIEAEQKIIHLMLKSIPALEECIDSGLSADLFTKNFKPLVEAIYKDFFASNKKRLLNREAYKYLVLAVTDKKNLIPYLKTYDACKLQVWAEFADLGYLKKEVLETYTGRKACEYLRQFTLDAKNKGYNFACKNLSDNLKSTTDIVETREVVFSSLKDLKESYIEQLEFNRKNPGQIVRCGIPEIDDVVNVGFQPGHLTLFVGDVGSYKTAVMLNVALNIAQKGFPVLFIPLEMPWKDLMTRIICNRVGIPNVKLSHPQELSDADLGKIKEATLWTDQHADMFCILDSKERFSVHSMRREIEKRINIFKPKVIIVDYADIFEMDVKYGSRTFEIGEMVKSIRHLGRRHDFHVISAAQMNRSAIKSLKEGKDDVVPDSTAIHGSHSYSADSDTIFALMKVPGEITRIKIHTIKARHGPSGQTNELTVDPTRSLISSCIGGSILTSEVDLENDMNRPPEDIAEMFSVSKRKLDFVTSSFDLDDIAAL